MIVGSTLKAKNAPVFATMPSEPSTAPVGSAIPTGTLLCTRLPKMKRAPCSWKPSSAVTRPPSHWKNHCPASVLRTARPKTSCRVSPLATRRQLMRRRSELISTTSPNITAMPSTPMSRWPRGMSRPPPSAAKRSAAVWFCKVARREVTNGSLVRSGRAPSGRRARARGGRRARTLPSPASRVPPR